MYAENMHGFCVIMRSSQIAFNNTQENRLVSVSFTIKADLLDVGYANSPVRAMKET